MDSKRDLFLAVSQQSSVIRARRLCLGVVTFAGVFALTAGGVLAQEPPAPPTKEIEEIRRAEEDAKGLMGDWDQHYLVVDQATDNIFQQQGWTSESDQYARNLMREVGRISPWKPQERGKVFMNSLQARYTLTEDQRTTLDADIQKETMTVAMKHFKSVFPVALEIMKARSSGQPFTPEQVQRWSKAFQPVMDESIGAVDRVVGRLEKTMTEDQRKILQNDTQALHKRHQDVQKMVERWEAGQWTPTDWGLQNDPIHAGVMSQYNAAQTEKDRLVQAANAKANQSEQSIARDESTWEAYVRQFCEQYECTDAQRTQAGAILKSCRKEALDYLAARRDQIAKNEAAGKSADVAPGEREKAARELERLMTPIGDIFNRLKAQLVGLLTSAQRAKFGAPTATPAPAKPATPPLRPAPQPPPTPTLPPAATQPAASSAPAASQPAAPPPAPAATQPAPPA
jgi:hypothetical protein